MTDPWQEGRYVDLWSLVHVHAGFLVAWALWAARLRTVQVAGLTLIVLALYEVGEELAHVHEYTTNRVTDLAFGMLGLGVAHRARSAGAGRPLVVGVAISFAVLGAWGWWVWLRRTGRL